MVNKAKKLLCVALCMTVFISCFVVLNVKATQYPIMGEIKNAYNRDVSLVFSLPAMTGKEANEEDRDKSEKLDELPNGTSVEVLGEDFDLDGDRWYNIRYGENYEKEGYAFAEHVILKYEYVYDEDFETNLQNFPESYHEALRNLHAKYPYWEFVACPFDLTFKEAVEAQYGVDNFKSTRKWVEFTYGGNEWRDMRAYNAETDEWVTEETRWTYASRAAIEYFMDPRNSLNEDMIFAFMKQSYQEDEKMRDNLRTVIKGTFLENGYDEDGDGTVDADAYIDDLILAAQQSNVSPYVLAATIIVEQGTKGETNLISGDYTYTYINDAGEEVIDDYSGYYNFFNYSASGSTKDAITISGLTYAMNNGWSSREAAIVGGAQKYADGYIDVGQDTYYYKDFNVVNQIWWHQYASALYDAWTNAKYLKKGCTTTTDTVIQFLVPIFSDMPEEACLPPSEVVIPDPPATPDPMPEPELPPEPVIKKGDTNDDGLINAVDLAAVKMDILNVKKLEGNPFEAGDVNDDGVINAVDLAAIKMHILNVRPIE